MTLWYSQRFILRWLPVVWTVGFVLPHGGMIVYVFQLGPLTLEFWPLAPKLDELEPF